jgi:hypothetical protein
MSQRWVDNVLLPILSRMLHRVSGGLRLSFIDFLDYYDWCAFVDFDSPSHLTPCMLRQMEEWFEEEAGFPMVYRPHDIDPLVVLLY